MPDIELELEKCKTDPLYFFEKYCNVVDPTYTKSSWIDINDDLPNYYEAVQVELIDGEVEICWRTNDGDKNIWTKLDSDIVFYDEEIIKWKR